MRPDSLLSHVLKCYAFVLYCYDQFIPDRDKLPRHLEVDESSRSGLQLVTKLLLEEESRRPDPLSWLIADVAMLSGRVRALTYAENTALGHLRMPPPPE